MRLDEGGARCGWMRVGLLDAAGRDLGWTG